MGDDLEFGRIESQPRRAMPLGCAHGGVVWTRFGQARFHVCGKEITPPPQYTRECGFDEYRLLPATAGLCVDNTGEICNVKDKCISDKYGAYGACCEPLHVSSFNVTFALIKKQRETTTAQAEASARVVPPKFTPWRSCSRH